LVSVAEVGLGETVEIVIAPAQVVLLHLLPPLASLARHEVFLNKYSSCGEKYTRMEVPEDETEWRI
jgi:hypothetical protein